MYEQDYIMRMIHDMVRMQLKLFFNIDEKTEPDIILMEDLHTGEKYDPLQDLLRRGEINDAENLLYEMIDPSRPEDLKLALLFYEQVSRIAPDVLEASDYSQEEIKEGIERILRMFGREAMDLF